MLLQLESKTIIFLVLLKCRLGKFLLLLTIISFFNCSVLQDRNDNESIVKEHLETVESFIANKKRWYISYEQKLKVTYSACFLENLTGISVTKDDYLVPEDLNNWKKWLESNKVTLTDINRAKEPCKGYLEP